MTSPTRALVRDAVAVALAHGDVAPLTLAGDPVLRTPAQPYEGQLDDDTLNALIELMRRTLRAAPGVGLAAVQIGVPLQLAVIEDVFDVPPDVAQARQREPVPFYALVNPTIAERGPETATFYEGCLSIPGYTAAIARNLSVTVQWTTPQGTRTEQAVHGWHARIVQHELDHLDGKLYLDTAEMRSLSTRENYEKHWEQPTPLAVADALGFAI